MQNFLIKDEKIKLSRQKEFWVFTEVVLKDLCKALKLSAHWYTKKYSFSSNFYTYLVVKLRFTLKLMIIKSFWIFFRIVLSYHCCHPCFFCYSFVYFPQNSTRGRKYFCERKLIRELICKFYCGKLKKNLFIIPVSSL